MDERACDEHRDERDLDREHGVELRRRGAREDAVVAREDEPRAAEDRQHAPPERPPALAEPAQRSGAVLALEAPRHRHGDEDERDRAAHPDGGGEQVQCGDGCLHPQDNTDGEARYLSCGSSL